jgi:hypothetical protein
MTYRVITLPRAERDALVHVDECHAAIRQYSTRSSAPQQSEQCNQIGRQREPTIRPCVYYGLKLLFPPLHIKD